MTQTQEGWYADPTKRHEQRYWSGSAWTEHVFTKGTQSVDPYVTEPLQVASPTGGGQGGDRKVPLFGARKHAGKLQDENDRLQALIEQHGLKEVAKLDATRIEIQDQITRAQADLASVQKALQSVESSKREAERDVVNLRATAGMQEFGIYDYEHPAESSVALAMELESVRSQIKQLVASKKATDATSGFMFNNSAKQGERFVADMSKLMLRSYNAEAENCVKTVKAGNLESAQKRLTKSMEQVERLGKMISLSITVPYHRLRLKELELAARHMQALQAEKEAERAHREELREQKRVEAELKAAKDKLEKERSHYENAIAALVEKGDEEGAARLREKLADTDKAIADVDYRAANARAGYVYVISNIGAFGPDVVKIGLTRRLDPMDRVNELGDASVPFRFDVHALFFADDAVTLESSLHQRFADRRLNKINLRREYFRATPQEVLDALKEQHVEVLEFTLEPAAEEYRASQVSA
ncbi:DUF4041 domain-containing protein [Demequina sp. NBRC 110054]|uniref:DUF4041 domain-containing protein n=1 Tax=Demequina sp. NBRC 110054 TaxID=1570343 RepID=UPI0009FE506E|nr:DUF4041 domain-containing protein [Demequina sp. NBRC 110054]